MNQHVSIGDDDLIRHRRDVIAAGSDGEMVVLDPDGGEFLDLSKTAARIWTLLGEPVTIAQLTRHLAEQFDVDAVTCRNEVRAFVGVLASRNLIETVASDR